MRTLMELCKLRLNIPDDNAMTAKGGRLNNRECEDNSNWVTVSKEELTIRVMVFYTRAGGGRIPPEYVILTKIPLNSILKRD